MYLIYYIEECYTKIKIFKTKKALDKFIIKLNKKPKSLDNWIEFTVKIDGEVFIYNDCIQLTQDKP